MRYTIAGKDNEKVVMLLPGTCCTAKFNFEKVVPMLAEKNKVICVDYDGFDGNEGNFTNMTDICKKIESYIIKRCEGEVFAVYGSSLGGSFVGLLVQRGNVHIRHAFIGSSDLDQSGKLSAKMQTAIVGKVFYRMVQKGSMPKWAENMTRKKMGDEATEKYLQMTKGMFEAAKSISKTSMKNQFYSDLVTPLADHISAPDTTVHVFYALQMGKKYRERYLKHFDAPDIREQNYGHEELLFFYPGKWFDEFEKCVEK